MINVVHFYLHMVLKMVTFLETESRMMVAGRGLEEEGNGKLTFNGCTVSILEDEKFWR